MMTSDELARAMEQVGAERDRLYTELMDTAYEPPGAFRRMREKLLTSQHNDRREEYKSLRAAYYRALEREEQEKERPASGEAEPAA